MHMLKLCGSGTKVGVAFATGGTRIRGCVDTAVRCRQRNVAPRRSNEGRLDPRAGPESMWIWNLSIHDYLSRLSMRGISWIRLCTASEIARALILGRP